MTRRFVDRIAVVTGASRGIGRATALALGREGAQVVALARTRGALTELDDEIRAAGGRPASLIVLNLMEFDRVDALGPALYERFGHVDILLANAAMLGPLSPLSHVQAKDWESVFALNVHANWRLLRTIDPLLRRSVAGKAAFVTTSTQTPSAYWGPYVSSKSALETMAKVYARELATTSARVVLINPGPVRTAMRQQAFPGEDASKLLSPEAAAAAILDVLMDETVASGETVRLDLKPPTA